MPLTFTAEDFTEDQKHTFTPEDFQEEYPPKLPPMWEPTTPKELAEQEAITRSQQNPIGTGFGIMGRGLVGLLDVAGRPLAEELYPAPAEIMPERPSAPATLPPYFSQKQLLGEEPMAAQEALGPGSPLPTPARFVGRAAQGLIETAPKLAAVAGAEMVGIPPMVSAPAIFGHTEQGFDWKQAAIAAALPVAGRVSGSIVGRVADILGVESPAAINWMMGIAGTAGPAGLMLAEGEREISKLPKEQQENARLELWESLAGQAALGPMGVKWRKGLNAIQRKGPQILRTVQEQSGEGPGEVPAEGSGGETGARGNQGAQASEAQQQRLLLKQKAEESLKEAQATGNEGLIQIAEENLNKVNDQIAAGERAERDAREASMDVDDRAELERQRMDEEIAQLQSDPDLANNKLKSDRLEDLKNQRETGFSDEEYAAYVEELRAEAEKMGAKGEVTQGLQGGEEPFAFGGGTYGRPTAEGFQIYGPKFRGILSRLPPHMRSKYIKFLVSHELFHRATTDAQAADYWNSLSVIEKRLLYRAYTGHWNPSELRYAMAQRGQVAPEFTPAQLGHEAIRRRLQKILLGSTSEAIEAESPGMLSRLKRLASGNIEGAIGEKLNVLQTDILSDIVRKAREKFASSESKTAEGTRALGEVGHKILMQRMGIKEGIPGEPTRQSQAAAFSFEKVGAGTTDEVRNFIGMIEANELRAGNKLSTAAGLGARSLDDLKALAATRRRYEDQQNRIYQRVKTTKGRDAQLGLLAQANALNPRVQLAREAIEVATNVGSWSQQAMPEVGARPLDWTKNPHVADWLKKNGPGLGISLPDQLKGGERPAAFDKDRHQRALDQNEFDTLYNAWFTKLKPWQQDTVRTYAKAVTTGENLDTALSNLKVGLGHGRDVERAIRSIQLANKLHLPPEHPANQRMQQPPPPNLPATFEKQRANEERKLRLTRAASAADEQMLKHLRTLPATQLEDMLKQRETYMRSQKLLKQTPQVMGMRRSFENQIRLLQQEIERRGEQAGPASFYKFPKISDEELWMKAISRPGLKTPVMNQLQLRRIQEDMGREDTFVDDMGNTLNLQIREDGIRMLALPPGYKRGDGYGVAETYHDPVTGEGWLEIDHYLPDVDKDMSLLAARELMSVYNNQIPEGPKPPGYGETSFPAAWQKITDREIWKEGKSMFGIRGPTLNLRELEYLKTMHGFGHEDFDEDTNTIFSGRVIRQGDDISIIMDAEPAEGPGVSMEIPDKFGMAKIVVDAQTGKTSFHIERGLEGIDRELTVAAARELITWFNKLPESRNPRLGEQSFPAATEKQGELPEQEKPAGGQLPFLPKKPSEQQELPVGAEQQPFAQPTAKAIEDVATAHLDKALSSGEPPKFNEFLGELQGKFGGGFTREKAFYPWMDSVTQHLLTAKGEEIRKLLGKMGLVPDVAEALKPTESHPFLGSIPDATPETVSPKVLKQAGFWVEDMPLPTKRRMKFEPAQQRRLAAIGAIFDQLASEAGGKPKGERYKTEIGPEDIANRFVVLEAAEPIMEGGAETGEFTQPVVESKRLFHRFTPEQAADAAVVGKIATETARLDPKAKRSLTRGTLALRDKINDKVILVSAWRHQRHGPVITNPAGKGPDLRISNQLFERYEPLSAITLREPTEGLRQVFQNETEFGRWFGTEGIEGTPGVKSSSLAGPLAGVAREQAGISSPPPRSEAEPLPEAPATPAPSKTGRELTLPRFARKTVLREPLQLPESSEQLQPPKPSGPKMLSEADQAALQEQIKAASGYEPTEFPQPSAELEKRGITIMPGARGERVPIERSGMGRFRKPVKKPAAFEKYQDFADKYAGEMEAVFNLLMKLPDQARADRLFDQFTTAYSQAKGDIDTNKLIPPYNEIFGQIKKHWDTIHQIGEENPHWTKLYVSKPNLIEGQPRVGPGTGPNAHAKMTPQEEYRYYEGRLRNPELLDHSIWVPFRDGVLLAVPVGGSRKSGSVGIIELMTKDEANSIADELRGQPGFPDVRVVEGPRMYQETPQAHYMVEWGKPIDWTTGRAPETEENRFLAALSRKMGNEPTGMIGEPSQEYHDRLGQQFGYEQGYGVDYPPDTAPWPMPGEPYPQKGLFGQDYPYSFSKVMQDSIDQVRDYAVDAWRRGVLEDQLAVGLDQIGNRKNNEAHQLELNVRLASVNKPPLKERLKFWRQHWTQGRREILSAANAVVEADGNQARLQDFRDQLDIAEQNANLMAQSTNWRDRQLAKAYKRDIAASRAEVEYADANWNNPALQLTARRVQRILNAQVNLERAMGINVRRQSGYVPHRLVDVWGQDTLFSLPHVIGTKFTAPRSFRNHYEALAAGPYMRITHDIASLVHHRVRQGLGKIYRDQWKAGLQTIMMPDGLPLVTDPVVISAGNIRAPNNNYKLVPTENFGYMAVHKDAADMMKNLLSPSWVESSPKVRRLLHWEQKLKHSLLIGDFFHFARMVYYGTSVLGRQALQTPGNIGKLGWSALDIAPGDINEAVRKGVITQREANWANTQIPGTALTRRDLVERAYRSSGANLGRITDALYKDLLTDLTPTAGKLRRAFVRTVDPTVGRYNRFLFDKMTRGLMAESIVREFERQFKPGTGMTIDGVLRDVSRDINERFGNIGRQGIFKSKTAQDLSRIFFLAPQWVEGMARTELRAAGRLSGAAALSGQREGLTKLGTTGYTTGKAMVFMFGLTQALNLITRGHPTWQNEEEGHKLDAWIPSIGKGGDGFWFNPFSLFMELTHDLYRLGENRFQRGEELGGALTQILQNKLSPVSRALLVMGSGYNPTGQRITKTHRRFLTEPGKAMMPVPITFGKYAQFAGHEVAPTLVREVPKGQMQRQAIGTLGVKVEPALSRPAVIGRLADKFMRTEGLKKDTGWEEVQTDEASYTKLRSAIRDHDDARAKDLYHDLLKSRTEEDVNKGMKLSYQRPFTGSSEAEKLFIESLSEKELQMYQAARERQMDEYEAFVNWLMRQP